MAAEYQLAGPIKRGWRTLQDVGGDLFGLGLEDVWLGTDAARQWAGEGPLRYAPGLRMGVDSFSSWIDGLTFRGTIEGIRGYDNSSIGSTIRSHLRLNAGAASDAMAYMAFLGGGGARAGVPKSVPRPALSTLDDFPRIRDVLADLPPVRFGDEAGVATKRLRRPYIRKCVREEVERVAERAPDGRPIDPNLRTPIHGKPDLGHKPGLEFWRLRRDAEAKGLTQRDFNDLLNDPGLYRLEEPLSNRSHRFEIPP